MPLRPEPPSPKAVVTPAETSDPENSASSWWHGLGREDRPADICAGATGDSRSGISSLHVGFCKSDQSGWRLVRADSLAPGATHRSGGATRRGVAGRGDRPQSYSWALDPEGPGAALGLWLDSTAQAWSPEPGWNLLLRALARLCEQDRAPGQHSP